MKSIKEIRESNLSLAAAKATNLTVSAPTKANHLAAVKAHKEAQGFFKGQAHDYHLNKAIQHAKKASEMKEEYGAGEEGSDAATQKYKDETPGQFTNEEDDICETASAGLAAKAKKTGFAIGTLRKVYRRGVAAWNSGHRPGTTPQQWGMARVNSYVTKGKGTYHGADKDLRSSFENNSDNDLQEETFESGYERRVVKTTSDDHKEKGFNWRIKGKDRSEVTIKLYKEKPSQEEFNSQMKRVAGHEFGEEVVHEGTRDSASGLPKTYVTGLSTATAKARAAHFDKANKMSDRDPEAYKPAPGDATSKTKESEHTKKYKAMFGENMDEEMYEACWDSYKQVGTKMKNGRRVPNCVPKNESVQEMDEAHKLGDKVTIVGGPKDVHGKTGRIGEIKHGLHKTASKTYTVDHDAGSVQLGKEHIRAVKEGANEDMAKHHAAAQAAKAAGGNNAFHKHMDAKFAVAQKRDAVNAKKPVTRMDEALEEACWKGCEEIELVKDKKNLDESVIHSAKAAKFSQKAKANPSIATHTKASSVHTKAAASYEKKIAAHIKANGESSLLKPMEDKAKHHERSATVHRFMAHRILKKNVNESTETVAESPEDKKNIKITKHSQLAVNAEKRGDKAAQAFHLRIVSKLKTESVTENKHTDDDQEEVIMAKSQLLQIADMAKDLSDMLEDDDELEAWIQGKITTACNELDDVHSYMEYTDDLYDDQHDVKEQFESLDEAVDSSELARIQMLVRLGLIDKLKLNVITRAIKKLDNSASITTTAEKDVLFDLLQKLISLITSDEMIFKKIKLNIGNTQ